MQFKIVCNMIKIFKVNSFIIIVLIIYLMIGIINIVLHEPWRDELHGWAIAMHSSDIFQLIENKEYDGQMHLWYILQFLITRFTTNPFFLQLLHLIIASGSIFIILKYSPFSKLQKFLLSFSYFLLYEYSTISRCYALGILFLFIVCTVYQHREKRFFLLVLLLCILCLINIYVLILSLVIFIVLVSELIQKYKKQNLSIKKVGISIVIFFAVVVFSVHQTIPPSDSAFLQWFHNPFKAMAGIWEAYFPVPVISMNFWNSNIITNYYIRAILSVMIFIPLLMLFVRNKWSLMLFFGGSVGILSFTILLYLGFIRHYGHYFLLFIISFWIFQYEKNDILLIKFAFIQKIAYFINKYRNLIFTSFLFLHFVVAVFACTIDWLNPFSANKQAAEFIKNNKLPDFIAADWDTPCSGISSLLNKDFYYLSCSCLRPYIKFNKSRVEYPKKEIIKRVYQLAVNQNDTILLILNYNLNETDEHHYMYLKKFDSSIVTDEVYYFYLVSPGNYHKPTT